MTHENDARNDAPDAHADVDGDADARDAATFAALAAAPPESRSTLAELGAFVRATRAYWLVPILVTLVVFAVLVAMSSTAVAPFVYTLF